MAELRVGKKVDHLDFDLAYQRVAERAEKWEPKTVDQKGKLWGRM